jgi:glycosyltransferase involved in cell wall biosynthesis
MSRKRVLFYHVISGLRDDFDVHAACLTGRGGIGDWLQRDGVPVHYVDMCCKYDLKGLLRMYRLIRKLQPEILQTMLFHANMAGRVIGWLAGVSRIVSGVAVCEMERPYHLALDRLSQWLTRGEVCVCETVREFTNRRAGVPPAKLFTIHSVGDVPEHPRPAGIRGEMAIPDGTAVIVSVGRLNVQKGFEYLLDSVARLKKTASRPFRVLIVGRGELEGKLEAHALKLGLDGFVDFLGFREDVHSVVAEADMFVLPSLWEGFPVALYEAMALGRAVVATDVSGNWELVKDGETGLLVPSKSPAKLAEAMKVLLDSPERRAIMGAAARDFVRRTYGVEKTVEGYRRLFRSL